MTDVASPPPAAPAKPKFDWRSHVIGTRAYRRKWHKQARRYMLLSRNLNTWLFLFDDWKQTRREMRHHNDREAFSNLWADAVALPLRLGFALASLTLVLLMPWIVSDVAGVSPQPVRGLPQPAAMAISWAVQLVLFFGFATVMLLSPTTSKGWRRIVPDGLWVFMSAVIWCLYAFVAYRFLAPRSHMHWISFTLACSLVSTVVLGVNSVTMTVINSSVLRIVEQRRRTMFGRSIAIGHLNRAAFYARDATQTERVIEGLENAAQVFEHDLARMHAARDPATESWTRKEFGAMAAAIRELKRLVIVRTKESSTKLQEAVRPFILAILREEWETVPRAETHDFWRQRPLARIGRAVRTVAIAVAPLTILAFAKGSIDSEARKVLTTGGYVWAAVGLMMVIDPDFTAKLAAMNLSSLFKGNKGE